MVKTLFCVEKLIMYHENKFCRLNLISRDRKFLYDQGWSAVEVKPTGRVLHVYEVFFMLLQLMSALPIRDIGNHLGA